MQLDLERLEPLIKKCRVPTDKNISLKKDFATRFDIDHTKNELTQALTDSVERLAKEQDKLYAQKNYSVLVILQALDAAGKDGTIKHVMSGVNPQGCSVHSFKAPSAEELDHDFLWRCNRRLPERGFIGIFNRSYYEEVLVSKVHPEILAKQRIPDSLTGKNIWKHRYEDICNWEKYLTNNGTIILKFFLNVSKEEQRKRFLKRIDLPAKNWKFSQSDSAERARWNDYQTAYQECFNATSTEWAPWYVIPADYKPLSRLLVSNILYSTLAGLKLHYPKVSKEAIKQLEKAKALLSEEGK